MAMEAVVLFDYEKQQEDELDLKLGVIIQDVHQADEGWCEGTLNGVRGMFPDNFVKLRPTGSAALSSKAIDGPPTVAPQAATPQAKVDSALPQSLKKIWRAKVTYSYAAENTDEINLAPGEVVEVLAEEEEGWWRGKVGGMEGLFPSNFVATISDDESTGSKHDKIPSRPPEKAADNPPSTARQSVLGPMLMAGFDPAQARSHLRKAGKSAPAIPHKDEPPKKAPHGGKPPAVPPPSGKQVEMAKVLFGYAAEEVDELSIKVGDTVEVVKRDAQEGWWQVRLDGKVGLVPDNFIEPLAAPKKPDPPQPYKEPVKKPAASPPVEVKRPPPLARSKPEKPPPPKPAEETDDGFGVPGTTPLDSTLVKNRPKNPIGRRPPSRVNLPEAADESPPPIPPAPVADEVKAPWQLELRKKRALPRPVPPKPTAASRPSPLAKPPPRSQSPPPADKPKPPPAKPAASKPAAPPPSKPAALPPKSQEPKPPAAPPLSTPPATVTPSEPLPPPAKVDKEWKEAFERLREEFERFKSDCLKDIEVLTKDLDEERKLRKALEVDVDRLKKTRGFRDVL